MREGKRAGNDYALTNKGNATTALLDVRVKARRGGDWVRLLRDRLISDEGERDQSIMRKEGCTRKQDNRARKGTSDHPIC